MFVIGGSRSIGGMITKNASALHTVLIENLRTLFVWMTFLINGREKFLFGELIGYLLVILGTLIYNEIIEIPIGCMKKNTYKNRAIKKEKEYDDL